jgi:hypothetical protein
MGDIQRIARISARINEIDSLLFIITSQRGILNTTIKTIQGDAFFDLFQEIAELDQTIWDLKVEKQRLNDLI